jgi:formate-dependent phosphoribosylglycinamide formyltransferase (GAR transformylase)
MVQKVIPFPQKISAPEVIVSRRRRIVVLLGSNRYAMEIAVSARPLGLKPVAVTPTAKEPEMRWQCSSWLLSAEILLYI